MSVPSTPSKASSSQWAPSSTVTAASSSSINTGSHASHGSMGSMIHSTVEQQLSPGAQMLMTHGGILTAYIAEPHSTFGAGGYFTRLLHLHYDPLSQCFYWSDPSAPPTRLASHAIPLHSLHHLYLGKHTNLLQWQVVSADPDKCFSVLWDEDSLDVECENEGIRECWMEIFDHLLTSIGKLVVETPEILSPDQLEHNAPIDPLSSLPRSPSHSMNSATRLSSASSAKSTLNMQQINPSTFQTSSFLASLAHAIDLDFSNFKSKRFMILNPRQATSPLTDSEVAEFQTLHATLQSFQSFIDAQPVKPPQSRENVEEKKGDESRSLESSLSRLGQGVEFIYYPPLDKLLKKGSVDALSPVALPGMATRRPSLSELTCEVLLFYSPHARRSTGRPGELGCVSWLDSQLWTKQHDWKFPLFIDSQIIIGKQTKNFQSELYKNVPSSLCFSLYNPSTQTSLDLSVSSWSILRGWLFDLDRILRSSGWTMVRTGQFEGKESTKLVFVSQSELRKHYNGPLHHSRRPSQSTQPLQDLSTLHEHSGEYSTTIKSQDDKRKSQRTDRTSGEKSVVGGDLPPSSSRGVDPSAASPSKQPSSSPRSRIQVPQLVSRPVALTSSSTSSASIQSSPNRPVNSSRDRLNFESNFIDLNDNASDRQQELEMPAMERGSSGSQNTRGRGRSYQADEEK